MKLNELNPRKALNKAFLKVKPIRVEIENFKTNLITLLDTTNDKESEEFHKNLVSDFLKDTYYKQNYFINTKGRNDLVIHNGNNAKTTVGVIIEAKKPTNKSEMISAKRLNAKAFQELVLYYLRERITHKNLDVKHLVATNINEWFIFDEHLFEKLFAQNKAFVKQFENFEASKKTTDVFYKEIAEPFIDSITSEIEYTYFNIQDFQKTLRNDDKSDDNSLIALFKLLSPEHLLKLPFANDSNSLDKRFYGELLHIIGLAETKEGGKKIIQRNKAGERNSGTILEDTIIQLDSLDKLSRLDKPSQFGTTTEEQLFNVALELAITWINRILFLKLLEGQLISYHRGDKSYAFLNGQNLKEYDDLNSLFFQVLARKVADRNEDVMKTFAKVPYLNSSLFEPTELEQITLFISNLKDDKTIQIYSQTVLKDQNGKTLTGKLTALQYLFEFLNAYDFSSEGSEEIQEENKTLINASVLGLIFEKINGYRDGSIFTPSFITMYMSKETLRKAVIQKFNEAKGWNCKNFDELKEDIQEEIKSGNRKEIRKIANQIINSLKIVDPAVGSGHFLVSVLNELITIKSELKILVDKDFEPLSAYQVEVQNDELIIIDSDGNLFQYFPNNVESQRIQETLFHEKQTLIENCLFGVDINPNSVKICRLRLWIELLKNAYYKNESELETLPNIDINIKCGNSLISRFALDSDLKQLLKKSKYSIQSYRVAVETYQNAKSKEQKREMERLIAEIKSDFRSEITLNDPKLKKLRKLSGDLFQMTNQGQLFEMSKKEKADWNKKVQQLTAETKKIENEIEEIKANKIFENAFEWRFEFPEVLNDDGEFLGFDVVIGNPPYIKEDANRDAFNGLRDLECYQGKIDIWYLFGDLGLKILKTNSYLCYIATNNWVTNAGASNFRNIVIQNSQIINLIDFGAYMIFENASIQTMIMLFKKTKTEDNYSFDYRRLEGDKRTFEDVSLLLKKSEKDNLNYLNPIVVKERLLNRTLTFNSDKNSILLDKIKERQNFIIIDKEDKDLGIQTEFGNGIDVMQDFVSKASATKMLNKAKVGDGVFVLSQEEFDKKEFSNKEKEILKPYYTSKQLNKYFGNSKNTQWIIYTKSDINKLDKKTQKIPIDSYPKIKSHLDFFKPIITSAFAPYGLNRAREQYMFEGDKILAQRKCPKEPIFTFTDFDCYVSRAFVVIKSNRINLKYLTGLLNSKLIAFWLRKKGKMQGNAYQLDKEPLLEIPIYNPSESDVVKIAKLVNDVITLKQEGKESSEQEKKIDQLVYELYGLTEEEIKIVEGV